MDSDQNLRVANAAAWEHFCDQLKAAGQILLRPETPVAELDRAEGLRYLARLTRLGLELCFEHADPDFPVFLNAWNATTKAGSDNPDNLYLNATVAGDREYRVHGHRGSAPRLRFSTFADRYRTEGKMVQTGSLRAKDMAFAADGTFEITVSRDPRPGNWLALAEDSRLLTVRQNFSDRKRETHATVTIERVGGPAAPRQLTLKRAQSSLQGALAFLARVTGRYAEWALWFQQRPNTVHIQEETPFHEEGGDPRTRYLHGYWAFGTDEALVLETPVPDCDVWNFQLSNYWMESLDFLHYPVCVNKHGAKYNADGSVTLVVAAKDPGIGNFLSTAGHQGGMMILRWTGAQECPLPTCRVVKLDSLRAAG
jgi:Protein of unknown function (DUF1214)